MAKISAERVKLYESVLGATTVRVLGDALKHQAMIDRRASEARLIEIVLAVAEELGIYEDDFGPWLNDHLERRKARRLRENRKAV